MALMAMCRSTARLCGSVSGSRSVLILVHDHVQSPVQAVFDAPVLANHLVESLRRQFRTEQVVSGFSGGFLRRFAFPLHLADGLQPWPLVLFLQPADLGGNRRRARLDASMIGLDKRRRACSLSTPDRQQQTTSSYSVP
jgi:hypothetical protein